MPLQIACACGKKLQVRDELAGKKVKCPGCGQVILAQAAHQALKKEAPPAAQQAIKKETPRVAPPPLLPPKSESKAKRVKDEAPREDTEEAPLYWRCKHSFGQRLLVLTRDALVHAQLKGKALDQAEEDLEEGEAPHEALGKDAIVIPFAIITKINTNKHLATMTVYFKGMEEGKEAIVNEVFDFGDKKERDRAFKTLRAWLEPAWTYTRKDFSAGEATVKPLIAIFVIVAVTIGLAWLADWLSTWTGRARIPALIIFLYYAMMWLGPPGIAVIGSLIVMCCMIWLVVRVRTPPIMLTLTPPSKPAEAKEDEEEDDED